MVLLPASAGAAGPGSTPASRPGGVDPAKSDLTRLSVTPNPFWVVGSIGPPPTVVFTLAERARVTFTVDRVTAGRAKRIGGFAASGRAGRNEIDFVGRLDGKPLRRGSYRLTAVTASGAERRTRFQVIRGPLVERASGAAVVSALEVGPKRFWPAGFMSGTTVSYDLSTATTVGFRVDRLTSGRMQGRRCVSHGKHGRRCTIAHRIGGFSRPGRTGANSFAFSGVLEGRSLRRGSYRLSAIPNAGRGDTARFAVITAPQVKGR
jgi:hypothetical protein